jgi:hypothetical protein
VGSTEDKSYDTKDSSYEELEHVFDELLHYHMQILLGNFNAKVGREDVSKLRNGNESLCETSNDNGVRAETFATLIVSVPSSTLS